MNGYNDEDPFDPTLPGSPENVFRRCPFASKRISGDSDSDSSDSEAFRVESTGIFMLSLPDSLEEKDDCTPHLYQTAPEELVPTDCGVPAEAIGAEVSPGAQSTTETGEKDKSIEIVGVCRSRSPEAKKSGLPFDESVVSLGESSSKKLRLSEEAMCSSSCARTVVDKFPVDSTNSGGGSKLVPPSSVSHNNGDEDSGGKCTLKRMNGKDTNDDIHEIHCNYIEKSAEKEVNEESMKNSQSHQQGKLQEEIANGHQSSYRVLPPSISGMKKTTAEKKFNTSEDHPIDVTLLEILKIFKGEEEKEIDIDIDDQLGILDMVQRRGMTFPRPEWWPPEV